MAVLAAAAAFSLPQETQEPTVSEVETLLAADVTLDLAPQQNEQIDKLNSTGSTRAPSQRPAGRVRLVAQQWAVSRRLSRQPRR